MTLARYAAYIRSQDWTNRCVRFFGDKPPCSVRGCWRRWDEGRVQVHHRTYERLGHEQRGDLVPLCEHHHHRAHEEAHRIYADAAGDLTKDEALRRGTDLVCPPEDVEQASHRWRVRD